MTGQRRLGLVAAGATLLAAAPLSAIFDRWTWLVQCVIAVGLTAGAATLTRSLRAPQWAQLAAMVGALLLALTWMFPSGDEFFALVPTPDTFAWFGQLMSQAVTDTRSYGVPVPDRDGLLFLTVLGVGGVAILVDLLTVALRRPALAGLPMLAIYSVPVAVYIDSVPVVPFVIGALGFLWLLVADNVDRVRRFGRRFTGDGRDVDVWEPSPLAAAGRRLGVIGIAAAVLLPLAVPGLTTGLLSQLTQVGTGSGSGPGGIGGGRVNLFANLSGQLNQNSVVEQIRVTTTERDPFYLRFGIADVITEQGFGSRSPRGRSISRQELPDPRANQRPGVRHEQFRATVEVTDNFNMALAPIYTTVIKADELNATWLYDTDAQVLYSTRELARDRRYEIDYVRSRFSPQALRTAQPLAPDNPLRTQLTTVPDNDFVSDLVAELTRDERTEYDKVLAIYEHFSAANDFTYSLQTEPATSGSQIEAFLRNKVGFCQQYAAAMAWLVRAAGIPARVAFGFTRGEQRGVNTYVVTNRNTHAWTEVYLGGFGWIPFDATPSAAVIGSTRSEWAPDVDRPEPTGPSATATANPTGTDPAAEQSQANRPIRDIDEDLAGAPGTDGGAGTGSPLLTAGLVALILALLTVPAMLRMLLRRRRHAATMAPPTVTAADAGGAPPGVARVVVSGAESVRARADAHAAWDELVDTMVDFGVPIDPAETPRHTAQRLIREAKLTGAAADGMTLLGRAEERARYAREPLRGGQLAAAVRQVRRALAAVADRRTRLVAVALPPSIMLRWRIALADRSVRLVGTFGRRRDAMARWNPRRLLANRVSR